MAATEAELQQLAAALVALGCPAAKAAGLAAQLDKRARQFVAERGVTYPQALAHLLGLFRQAAGQAPAAGPGAHRPPWTSSSASNE